MKLRNRLKEIRMKEYMKSAKEFAEMLDVKKSTYSQWENEQNNPTLEKAYEVSKKLNREVIEIWYEE